MGQQQILLVILVTIIIGIATVVALDAVKAASEEANKSAVRQDILMVINDAQIYYQKPKALGGGGYKFDGISNNYIKSIDPDNENGSYELSGSGDSITVVGTGNHDAFELSATAKMTTDGMDISWSEDE
jgi:Tfp pilus assembly protein PilE